jgi:hypothetical protein
VPYAHGAWLFRVAELPEATRELLLEGFDAGATLVESVNRQMAPLVEVFGSCEVFASPTRSTEPDDASEPVACVSTAVFVDEMMDGDKPWPWATEKTRDEPPPGPPRPHARRDERGRIDARVAERAVRVFGHL